MITWYDRIKGFYNKGYWTKSMVADGVTTGKITDKQYTLITGDPYIV